MKLPPEFTRVCLAISEDEDAVLMIDGQVLAVIQLLGKTRTKLRICAPREIRVIREHMEDNREQDD
jgi:sRNA-binding carbon storage regulator CsrA